MSQNPLKGAAESPIKMERDENILILTLDRIAKRNALNDAAIHAIAHCFDTLPSDIRAVVIAANGDNFSAGLDLSELSERDATEGLFHSRLWHQAFEKIEFGRVPVIAVLKGAVIGGGLELASAAHIRVAESTAFYALPEGQRGIFVGGGGSVRLPRLIGASRMGEMMLTGRSYNAVDGQSMGISHYLVGQGQGLAKAMELARIVAGNAPLTNFAVIQALPLIAEADPKAGYLLESLMSSLAQSDTEAKSRVRAFLDKKAAKAKRPE